ncbi:hypothetical protein GOBAR_DD23788 [Gossypium barbadense]|nr:hypothetical protein GOBAR_DD23788 [Gossypium barbadense]
MKNENESASHDKSVQQIQHPFHRQHPLVLVAEQSNEGLKAHSDGCGELLLAPYFTCIHCNYHLHKQCAEAPLYLHNHPLHSKHSGAGLFLRRGPYPRDLKVYGCALCKEKCNMFFYLCRECYFSIDIKCAQLSSSFKFSQLSKHDIHQHPLTFIESPMAIDVFKRFSCSWCHEPLTDATYFCSNCPSFIIHKKCLDELPTEINHPSHHIHPLFLYYSDRNHFCNLCQKEHSRAFYGCSLCHFNINLECALLRRPGCNYVVHVNCVLEDARLYKVIEDEKQCEELEEKSMQSSIIRIIEVNEAGEATKIEHFSHQHCLVLADKLEEEIDRKFNILVVSSIELEDIWTCAQGVLKLLISLNVNDTNTFSFLISNARRNIMVVAKGVCMVHSDVESADLL